MKKIEVELHEAIVNKREFKKGNEMNNENNENKEEKKLTRNEFCNAMNYRCIPTYKCYNCKYSQRISLVGWVCQHPMLEAPIPVDLSCTCDSWEYDE